MSVSAIERLLWEFGEKESRIEQFKETPDAYMNGRDITDGERQMLKDMDVKGLVDHGVSSMLTMMVWPMMNGVDDMPFDYLTRMNGGTLPSMGLTRFQHAGLKTFLFLRAFWWSIVGKPNKKSMADM